MAKLKGMELPRPNLASRLGTATGAALAEQIPKEVNRLRLASGIENLGNQTEALSPFQQVAKVYGIPGMTPEMAQVLLPYIQQQQIQKEAAAAQQKRQEGSAAQIPQQASLTPQAQPSPETLTGGQASRRLRELTEPEVEAETNQLQASRPFEFGTNREKARNYVIERQAKELRAQQQLENRENETATNFNNLLAGKDVKGIAEMKSKFLERAQADVDSGKLRPVEAARKYTDELLDFDKTRQKLKTLGGTGFFQNPSKALNNIEAMRKKYDEAGFPHLFRDDLMGEVGLTVLPASSVAFPISRNPAIAKEISKLPRRPNIDKFVKNIENHLDKDDSLLSIAYALYKKGDLSNEFIDKIKEADDEGRISLSKPQREELASPLPLGPSLKDLFFTDVTGYDPLRKK